MDEIDLTAAPGVLLDRPDHRVAHHRTAYQRRAAESLQDAVRAARLRTGLMEQFELEHRGATLDEAMRVHVQRVPFLSARELPAS